MLLERPRISFRRIIPSYYRRPKFARCLEAILFLEDEAFLPELVHSVVRLGKRGFSGFSPQA